MYIHIYIYIYTYIYIYIYNIIDMIYQYDLSLTHNLWPYVHRHLAARMSALTGMDKEQILRNHDRYYGTTITAWKYGARRMYNSSEFIHGHPLGHIFLVSPQTQLLIFLIFHRFFSCDLNNCVWIAVEPRVASDMFLINLDFQTV